MTRYVCKDAYSDIIWLFELTSSMPHKNPTILQRIRATIIWGWCLAFSITLVMEICISYDNIEIMCEILHLFTAYINTLIKKYVYVKGDRFLLILQMLECPEFNDQEEAVRQPLNICVKNAKKLFKSFLSAVSVVIILYAIFPFFDDQELSVPFSFNIGNHTMYFRLFQIVGVSLACMTIIGVDSFCAVLLMIAAAQVDILRLKLLGSNFVGKRLEEDQFEREEKIQKNLKECVRLHLCIIEYVAELEKLYSAPLLSQYTTSMAVVCLIMMQIMFMAEFPSIRFVLLVMIIMGLSFQLVLYHYFGNELVIKSSEIAEACYCSAWYYYGPKARKMLLIIMERAKRPLYLSIYGFDMVTLSSFLKVYKWSYSMFAVLRSIYKD